MTAAAATPERLDEPVVRSRELQVVGDASLPVVLLGTSAHRRMYSSSTRQMIRQCSNLCSPSKLCVLNHGPHLERLFGVGCCEDGRRRLGEEEDRR